MIKARLLLTITGLEHFSTICSYASTLAALPLLGYRIALPIPPEYLTNVKQDFIAFPTEVYDGATRIFSVRGVVMLSDGSIDVCIGPEQEFMYSLEEIWKYFEMSGWETTPSAKWNRPY